MAEPDFDAAVQAFLRANVVPRRLREARVAEKLGAVDPVRVPSRWGELAAWRLGTGPAVLLVHGWEDDNSLWSPLIDELASRQRALVAFDLPGHGASGGEWGLGWESADGMRAVAAALGPVDAVVAHSFGAGSALAAINEGLDVERAVLIAPPLGRGNRWRRYAERLGVSDDVAAAAQRIYEDAVGPHRVALDTSDIARTLAIDLLFVHSRDDERNPFDKATQIVPLSRRAELFAVDGLNHRRTARDPDVVRRIAEFVTA